VIAPLVGQFGEMGQFSFGHVLIDENRIHPIQAENDNAVDMTFFVGFLASDQPQEKTKRPGKEGKNGQEKCQEKHEKRGQKGKSCSGTDVCTERYSEGKEKQNKECPF
jgi:hypothetical protein